MRLNVKVPVFVRVMLVVVVSMSIQLVSSRTASQVRQEIDGNVQRPEWSSKLYDYYRMKDPKAAAQLMLEDAAARGIDVDRNPRPYHRRPGAILVPSGGFTPPEGNGHSWTRSALCSRSACPRGIRSAFSSSKGACPCARSRA